MRRRGLSLSIGMLALVASNAGTGCGGDKQEIEFTEDTPIDGTSDGNDPDSSGTKMCVARGASSSTIYVLWLDNRLQPDEDRVDIWMNRSVDLGASWLPAPIKVNQGEASNVWAPDLFCNELGVFVVWEDDRDGELDNHQIYFNRSTDVGQSFMPEDILLERDPDGLSMSLEPKITGFGQDLRVAWYDSLNGAYDILVSSSSDAGASWNDPVRVDSDEPPGSAYSARPKISLGNNAVDVWVVWEDSRDGNADIYFAHSDNGGTKFDTDERLDKGDADGANDSFEPQLCADPATGSVYSVWHDARNGDGRDIYMNYSPDKGSTWLGTAVRLDSDTAALGNSLFPQCVAKGTSMYATWYDKRSSDLGYDIYLREANAGNPGNAEVRLDVGGGFPEGYANSLNPRIALDENTLFVAWEDGRGEVQNGTENGYDDLYYNYTTIGTPFPTAEDFRIDSMYDGKSFKVDLNVAVLNGRWFAAWTDGRNGTSDIYFQSFQLGEQAQPPPLDALEQTGN